MYYYNLYKHLLTKSFVFRFASFIEGSSHLYDDEIQEYESSQYGLGNISNDDSDDSDADHFDDDLNDEVVANTGHNRHDIGLSERNSMTRTSTPTIAKTNGTNGRVLYRGNNGAAELSDDDE